MFTISDDKCRSAHGHVAQVAPAACTWLLRIMAKDLCVDV